MTPVVDIGDLEPGKPSRPAPGSWFTGNSGVKYTHPDGSAEHADQAYRAGMRWCSIITTDTYAVGDWAKVVEKHREAGLRVGAGGRVYRPGQIRSQIELASRDIRISFVFLNIEDELMAALPPAVVNEEIKAACLEFGFPVDNVWLNTVGWIYGSMPVTKEQRDYWRPIVWLPTALQVYWEDMHQPQSELERLLHDCFDRAHALGFRDLQPTFLIERSDPQYIDFWEGKPRSYFTGNSLGSQNWPKGWWV